jgi:hypothetical protein
VLCSGLVLRVGALTLTRPCLSFTDDNDVRDVLPVSSPRLPKSLSGVYNSNLSVDM